MFPKDFVKSIPGYHVNSHMGVSFSTNKSKIQTLNAIKKMGIGNFLQEDNPIKYNSFEYNYGKNKTKLYNDDRIVGSPILHSMTQCCSWTKASDRWFLFPFPESNFKAVGITIDDALHYIKSLNDLNVGFKYLYLGLQEGGERLKPIRATGEFHWFAVPKTANKDGNHPPYHIMYLHWIFLRMLVNTHYNDGFHIQSLPYFNFPRIFMYMMEDLKVAPWKAFLYTHATTAWYNYYSMTHAHADINNPLHKFMVPDLGITKKDFKAVWTSGTTNMNDAFTAGSNEFFKTKKLNITLEGKHDVNTCISLWSGKQYHEFVQYMDSVYSSESKKKADSSKAKLITRGKKSATKKSAKAN